jgi:sterol desaturase/sphingolipid hydroxylase (fatty acid hydroxylase superfamily)
MSVEKENIGLHFGWLFDRIVVSPAFHRRHHAIGFGHEGTTYGCNFGVLFSFWDILFRSASFNRTVEPTGIRDQLGAPGVKPVHYGDGFIEQHWLAFKRIAARLSARRAGASASDNSAAV